MPETADVGDAGSVFAPASGAHKRPRMEAIHGPEKKRFYPPKKRCLGGGRVSGLSRENLISSLIPRVELVQQTLIVVTPVDSESGATRERRLNSDYDLYETSSRVSQPPPSEAVRPTTRGWVNLSIEQDLRGYTEIHAETEAASAQWLAQTEDDARRWGDSLPEIPEEVIASKTVAHPSAQQGVASGSEASQASAATQSVSSMLQSFAYDDTRDGFDHFTLG